MRLMKASTDFDAETAKTQYILGSNKWVELGEPDADADHPLKTSSSNLATRP
ncbi:hypothetical protein E4U34_007755, partial [Claviceps purpurea]